MQRENIRNLFSSDVFLILFFVIAKLLVHFLTVSNFELHRDAYLYYAQSEHLSWGFISVPPTIAVIGKLATLLFGNTVFGLRFFPAFIGGMSILIIGLGVRELGGRKMAISLACLAFLFSPSYLHTNALFQPVAFDHFYWLLSSFLFLKLVKKNDPKYWIAIGAILGLAFLNKYTIVFLFTAFVISLLLSKHRHLFVSKYFLIALIIGLVIISPNLFWQYQHNWPVLQHMTELRETQLIHVRYSDFIIAQFLMNIQAVIIWLVALIILLFHKQERQYQLIGFSFIFVIALLMAGSGKAYYTLGIYPILFVFGAYFIEKYARKYKTWIFSLLVVFMFVAFYISLSHDGIPFVSFEYAVNKNAHRWEDGVYHDIPQDMADMTGWKEIGEEVSKIYVSLGDDKVNCEIYCYHYGQAGAVMFYGKEYGIPQPIAPTGSFIFWSPENLNKEYVIYVHSVLGNDVDPEVRLPQLFEEVTLKKVIDNPYFRENGTRIYLCETPTDECKSFYHERMKDLKDNYR